MKTRNPKAEARWLTAGGYALCVAPPAVAVAEHFPLWLQTDERCAFSALGILLLLLCCLPFWKTLKARLRSPSVWQFWLGLFVVLWLGRSLIDGLVAVAFMGTVGSIPGAILLRAGRQRAERAREAEAAPRTGQAGHNTPASAAPDTPTSPAPDTPASAEADGRDAAPDLTPNSEK